MSSQITLLKITVSLVQFQPWAPPVLLNRLMFLHVFPKIGIPLVDSELGRACSTIGLVMARERLGRMHDPAEEADRPPRGYAELRPWGRRTRSSAVMDVDHSEACAWQPEAGQPSERFRHERRAQSMLLGDRAGHELEERVPIGGRQGVGKVPVDFELTVGVLVIVLIYNSAELQHVIANFGDNIVAPHQRLLVVARLRRRILGVRDRAAIG